MNDMKMMDNFVNETCWLVMMMSFCYDDDSWKLPISKDSGMNFIIILFVYCIFVRFVFRFAFVCDRKL